MDQIVNNAAKLRHMSGGQLRCPIVFRGPGGAGGRLSSQHSQALESTYAHFPGLKVVAPATPADAKGLLKSAIRDENPVIMIEGERLYALKGEVPEGEHVVPLGKADIKREGKDVTVVAIAWMVHEALAAAEELAKEGISVEVVDPRTLVPMDKETIRASVRKTGRLVVADEAMPTASAAAEISAFVTEDPQTFAALRGPVIRVCALEAPVPYAPVLENHVFPDRNKIVAAVRSLVKGRKAA
jgi:pyruvate dehydrogenase E1 component beta subunit